MRGPQQLTADVSDAWQRFWFAPSDPLPLGVMRILLGAMLFYSHLIWSLDLIGFFGASGWNNAGIIKSLQQDTLAWSLWWFVPTGAEYQFHVGCLIVLFLFWIGFATRATSILAWIITVSYAHRSMLSNFGLDQVNAMLAFYLMLAPCGARLSFDSWWRKRKKIAVTPSASATLAARLIQVHICVIYVWAGLSKLQGSAWWTGDAIWQVIANYEYQSADLTWLANYPTVLQLATHGLLLFEITFPFLVFHRRLRPLAFAIGIALHLGIGAFLGMWTFGLIMICGYLAFFNADEIRSAGNALVAFVARVGRVQAEVALPEEKQPQVRNGIRLALPAPDQPADQELHDPNSAPGEGRRPIAANETASLPQVAPQPEWDASASSAHVLTNGSPRSRRRFVADELLYVARSKQQRANVRAYFRRHDMACCVLRGAAELIERTVNLRKATIVLRAKDFSRTELQFWCDELAETNPQGQFRIFLLPDSTQRNTTEGLEVPPRIRLFRLSATTTLRRIRKLYVNQDWNATPSADDDSIPPAANTIRAAKFMSWLFILLVLTGCGAKKNTPKVQLERARMLLERGQLHDSVQAFTTALSQANGSADDYYDRGVAYERLKQLEQAAADYTEALRLAPMHSQALNNRAVVLAQMGRVEDALLDLSQAIEINPNDALAWGNRGLARHESGAFAEAIDDYSHAIELTQEPRLYFQRGNVYVDFDRPQQAVEDFSAAIDLDKDFVRAYLNRANAFVQLGKLDEAVADMQKASQMDSEVSMTGAIQQLRQQIRGEQWQDTAAAGLAQWLKTEGYEIRPAQDESLSPFMLVGDSGHDAGAACFISPTGPRGAPVFEVSLSEKLVGFEGQVALLVVDKQELIRSDRMPSADRPAWLKDWRFDWKPVESDFVPSQVEVLLGPPADSLSTEQ